MEVNLKTANFQLTDEVRSHLQSQIDGFEKFTGNIKPESVQIWVEIGRTTKHHQKGDVFRVEFQLKTPGRNYISEAVGENIFQAINRAGDSMERELQKTKDRQMGRQRKGWRRVKRIVRDDWLGFIRAKRQKRLQ